MGGIVKGIKKAFKAVGGFVKKYWKVIVIAAAIYFTAGMAMAAMPAAGGVAAGGTMAGVEAGAGYSAMATGVAASAEAGSMTAALGITTASGYGAAAAGMTAAEFTAAGGVAAGVGLGAAEAGGAAAVAGGAAAEGMPGITSSLEGTGFGAETATAGGGLPGITSPVEGSGYGEAAGGPVSDISANAPAAGGAGTGGGGAGTSLVSKATGAVKGFWGGMSTGEKLMFASTAFNAISGAMKDPTRAEEGLWPGGAYFGMDDKGNKTDLAGAYAQGIKGNNVDGSPGAGTTPPATAATAQPQQSQQPGSMQQSGAMDVAGSMAPAAPGASAAANTAAGGDFMPAAGSGAANMQRANTAQAKNLSQGASRNEQFFDDLRDRLDANHS